MQRAESKPLLGNSESKPLISSGTEAVAPPRSSASGVGASGVGSLPEGILPEGWVEAFDERYDMTYYYNPQVCRV